MFWRLKLNTVLFRFWAHSIVNIVYTGFVQKISTTVAHLSIAIYWFMSMTFLSMRFLLLVQDGLLSRWTGLVWNTKLPVIFLVEILFEWMVFIGRGKWMMFKVFDRIYCKTWQKWNGLCQLRTPRSKKLYVRASAKRKRPVFFYLIEGRCATFNAALRQLIFLNAFSVTA